MASKETIYQYHVINVLKYTSKDSVQIPDFFKWIMGKRKEWKTHFDYTNIRQKFENKISLSVEEKTVSGPRYHFTSKLL